MWWSVWSVWSVWERGVEVQKRKGWEQQGNRRRGPGPCQRSASSAIMPRRTSTEGSGEFDLTPYEEVRSRLPGHVLTNMRQASGTAAAPEHAPH